MVRKLSQSPIFLRNLVHDIICLRADERGSLDAVHEDAKLEVAEEHNINTLPPAGPHRIYVVEPIFPMA